MDELRQAQREIEQLNFDLTRRRAGFVRTGLQGIPSVLGGAGTLLNNVFRTNLFGSAPSSNALQSPTPAASTRLPGVHGGWNLGMYPRLRAAGFVGGELLGGLGTVAGPSGLLGLMSGGAGLAYRGLQGAIDGLVKLPDVIIRQFPRTRMAWQMATTRGTVSSTDVNRLFAESDLRKLGSWLVREMPNARVLGRGLFGGITGGETIEWPKAVRDGMAKGFDVASKGLESAMNRLERAVTASTNFMLRETPTFRTLWRAMTTRGVVGNELFGAARTDIGRVGASFWREMPWARAAARDMGLTPMYSNTQIFSEARTTLDIRGALGRAFERSIRELPWLRSTGWTLAHGRPIDPGLQARYYSEATTTMRMPTMPEIFSRLEAGGKGISGLASRGLSRITSLLSPVYGAMPSLGKGILTSQDVSQIFSEATTTLTMQGIRSTASAIKSAVTSWVTTQVAKIGSTAKGVYNFGKGIYNNPELANILSEGKYSSTLKLFREATIEQAIRQEVGYGMDRPLAEKVIGEQVQRGTLDVSRAAQAEAVYGMSTADLKKLAQDKGLNIKPEDWQTIDTFRSERGRRETLLEQHRREVATPEYTKAREEFTAGMERQRELRNVRGALTRTGVNFGVNPVAFGEEVITGLPQYSGQKRVEVMQKIYREVNKDWSQLEEINSQIEKYEKITSQQTGAGAGTARGGTRIAQRLEKLRARRMQILSEGVFAGIEKEMSDISRSIEGTATEIGSAQKLGVQSMDLRILRSAEERLARLKQEGYITTGPGAAPQAVEAQTQISEQRRKIDQQIKTGRVEQFITFDPDVAKQMTRDLKMADTQIIKLETALEELRTQAIKGGKSMQDLQSFTQEMKNEFRYMEKAGAEAKIMERLAGYRDMQTSLRAATEGRPNEAFWYTVPGQMQQAQNFEKLTRLVSEAQTGGFNERILKEMDSIFKQMPASVVEGNKYLIENIKDYAGASRLGIQGYTGATQGLFSTLAQNLPEATKGMTLVEDWLKKAMKAEKVEDIFSSISDAVKKGGLRGSENIEKVMVEFAKEMEVAVKAGSTVAEAAKGALMNIKLSEMTGGGTFNAIRAAEHPRMGAGGILGSIAAMTGVELVASHIKDTYGLSNMQTYGLMGAGLGGAGLIGALAKGGLKMGTMMPQGGKNFALELLSDIFGSVKNIIAPQFAIAENFGVGVKLEADMLKNPIKAFFSPIRNIGKALEGEGALVGEAATTMGKFKGFLEKMGKFAPLLDSLIVMGGAYMGYLEDKKKFGGKLGFMSGMGANVVESGLDFGVSVGAFAGVSKILGLITNSLGMWGKIINFALSGLSAMGAHELFMPVIQSLKKGIYRTLNIDTTEVIRSDADRRMSAFSPAAQRDMEFQRANMELEKLRRDSQISLPQQAFQTLMPVLGAGGMMALFDNFNKRYPEILSKTKQMSDAQIFRDYVGQGQNVGELRKSGFGQYLVNQGRFPMYERLAEQMGDALTRAKNETSWETFVRIATMRENPRATAEETMTRIQKEWERDTKKYAGDEKARREQARQDLALYEATKISTLGLIAFREALALSTAAANDMASFMKTPEETVGAGSQVVGAVQYPMFRGLLERTPSDIVQIQNRQLFQAYGSITDADAALRARMDQQVGNRRKSMENLSILREQGSQDFVQALSNKKITGQERKDILDLQTVVQTVAELEKEKRQINTQIRNAPKGERKDLESKLEETQKRYESAVVDQQLLANKVEESARKRSQALNMFVTIPVVDTTKKAIESRNIRAVGSVESLNDAEKQLQGERQKFVDLKLPYETKEEKAKVDSAMQEFDTAANKIKDLKVIANKETSPLFSIANMVGQQTQAISNIDLAEATYNKINKILLDRREIYKDINMEMQSNLRAARDMLELNRALMQAAQQRIGWEKEGALMLKAQYSQSPIGPMWGKVAAPDLSQMFRLPHQMSVAERVGMDESMQSDIAEFNRLKAAINEKTTDLTTRATLSDRSRAEQETYARMQKEFEAKASARGVRGNEVAPDAMLEGLTNKVEETLKTRESTAKANQEKVKQAEQATAEASEKQRAIFEKHVDRKSVV